VRVRWLPGEVVFEVAHGDALIDAIDEQPGLQLPMACRAANCGTCRVRVLSGGSHVIPPDPWEQQTLAIHSAGPDERLGCQLRFNNDTNAGHGGGLVELERA
jgi:ferredoxin